MVQSFVPIDSPSRNTLKTRNSYSVHASRAAGFTLMEIMLVVTIIALLAGLAIFKMGGVVGVGETAAARADLQSFRTALIAYRATAGTFPSTAQGLQALVRRPEGDPKPLMWRPVFEGDIKQDPWRHDFVYKRPGDKNPTSYDLYSVGEDGKAGTEDDIWPD
jgi:general secretion pathway protein G